MPSRSCGAFVNPPWCVLGILSFAQEYMCFLSRWFFPVGFQENLSLLDGFVYISFRGLQQMEGYRAVPKPHIPLSRKCSSRARNRGWRNSSNWRNTYCRWLRNPFRTTLNPWDTIICWYLRGSHLILGFLRWCLGGFRPSTNPQYDWGKPPTNWCMQGLVGFGGQVFRLEQCSTSATPQQMSVDQSQKRGSFPLHMVFCWGPLSICWGNPP